MATRRFTPLRTDDADLTRVQDEVARALNPALASLDALGAAPVWIAATLQNSWVNEGGSTALVGYYRDALGVVHLRGSMKTGTIGTVALVLPPGYRPSALSAFPVSSNNAFGMLLIDASGNCTPFAGSNVDFTLSGISFPAEQ